MHTCAIFLSVQLSDCFSLSILFLRRLSSLVFPCNRNHAIRHGDLEHQRLVVQVIPARVRVRERTEIQKPVLRDEIIITHTEHKVVGAVVCRAVARICRHDADALPLLIEQELVLRAAVMHAEALELTVDVEVEEGAVLRRGDARIEHASRAGDGAVGGVVDGGEDVGGGGNVDDVDMAVERGRGGLAVAGVRVAG